MTPKRAVFMKAFKIILVSFIMFSLHAQGDQLVLSSHLKLEYPAPILISHTENRLIIKYKDTAISHNIVNPKTMYPNIDLSGYHINYIYTLFDKKIDAALPTVINELANQQKEIMGLNKQQGYLKTTQYYQLLASYDPKNQIAHVFIIEENKTHHLAIDGNQDYLYKIINGIKVR